jgi:hypothetical protein
MVRMNIMMPDDLAVYLKSVSNKSRYIAEALEEKIRRERSRKLREQLASAYADSSAEDSACARDWSGTLNDGAWRE